MTKSRNSTGSKPQASSSEDNVGESSSAAPPRRNTPMNSEDPIDESSFTTTRPPPRRYTRGKASGDIDMVSKEDNPGSDSQVEQAESTPMRKMRGAPIERKEDDASAGGDEEEIDIFNLDQLFPQRPFRPFRTCMYDGIDRSPLLCGIDEDDGWPRGLL